jgi:hypothetical protein
MESRPPPPPLAGLARTVLDLKVYVHCIWFAFYIKVQHRNLQRRAHRPIIFQYDVREKTNYKKQIIHICVCVISHIKKRKPTPTLKQEKLAVIF